MGLCKEVFIDQKLFEFRKENARWRIIESSHRGMKYISVDWETLGWLGSMVKECAVTLGTQEFLRTRRKGDTVIIVRKGRNFNGSFISISEFGRDKRRGLLVIPEGRKGEGWKKLADILMEMADIQIVAAKKNKGEGGAPSSWAGGARSYSEVLKKVPYRAALDVVSGVTISEDVQRHGVAESRLAGLNEESILKMLAGLEEKIGIVLDEINYLKRCVKGKEVVGRNGGLGMGLGRAMGLGKGQASGPVKAWRAVETVGSGKVLGSEISDQGQRVAPISSLPATLPAQKLPTTSVEPSGETEKEIRLGFEILDQGHVAPVAPISALLATLPAQKLPTPSVDHSGETVKEFRREEVEEGEFLALTSASVENGLSKLCVVDEVPEVVHEQSGLRDREMSLCGEVFSRDSDVVQSGLPLLVMSRPDELFSGDDSPLNNMVLSGETNKLDVLVIPNNSVGEEGALTPLCTLPPSDYGSCSTNWIFKKVEELQKIFGVSFGGYEEQFMALLVAIEASRSKSASKQDRELKRLTCSINYDVKEGSSGRVRSKGRGKLSFNEA